MTVVRLLLAVLAIALPLAGGLLLYTSFQPAPPAISINKVVVSDPTLSTHFQLASIHQWQIQKNAAKFNLNVAAYVDDSGTHRQAIVFLPPLTMQAPALSQNDLRYKVWSQASTLINQHVPADSLFLSWWDNAQRLHLFTGHSHWVDRPVAELYTDEDDRQLWSEISNGLSKNPQTGKQLAQWLAMDAAQAIKEIKATLAENQHAAYLLVSVDDLARIQEIEQISGKKFALASQVFYQGDNIHSQIARVKQWARQPGDGSYLLQPLPGIGVRAWKPLDKQTENSLLIRLLPFTHALETPLPEIHRVFKSEWGGYISVFQLTGT